MNVEISCAKEMSKFDEVLKLCTETGIFKEKVLVTQAASISENSIQLSIDEDAHSFKLSMPSLQYCKIVDSENFIDELKMLVFQCLGFKKTILTGLVVKDSTGNKTKPTAEIYAPKTLLYEIPDLLTYTKASDNEHMASLQPRMIFTDSEILYDILQTRTLTFTAENKVFLLKLEPSGLSIYSEKILPSLPVDFITNHTVNQNFYEIINSRHCKLSSAFIQFLDGRHDITLSKQFKKRIASRKDLFYCLHVAENAPKFYDSRDEAIDKLKAYLVKDYPISIISKYEYLETFVQRLPLKKNKNSLRSLFNP